MIGENIPKNDNFNVVISGGGPVALASALEAIKAGKRVAIISERDIDLPNPEEQRMVFSRGQRIFLDEQTRYYLLKQFPPDFRNNPDDLKFFMNLTTNITIKVREIERFLYRRIDEERKKNNDIVEFFNKREVKDIDMENGNAIIGPSRKEQQSNASQRAIKFQYMIGADGAAHHAANKLNANPNSQDVIKYKDIPAPKHPYHAAVSVNIRGENGPLKLPRNQFIEVATKMDDEKTYLAGISLNRRKNDPDTIKCVFGGEIPKQLFDQIQQAKTEQQKKDVREDVIKHMKKVIAKELGVEPKDLAIDFRTMREFDEKKGVKREAHEAYQKAKSHILNLQAFETTLKRADKAHYEKNDHHFLLAGDAYRIPNYQFGHGLNHAFKHAQYIGEVVSGKISASEYDKRCHDLSKEIENPNWFLNKLKSLGNMILVSEGNKRPDRVRKQFSGLKNPQIAELIEPLNHYINTTSMLTGHKSSAKKLLAEIKKTDQRPWDVLLCVDAELRRVKNKSFPFNVGADNYRQSLETTYKLVKAAYLDEQRQMHMQAQLHSEAQKTLASSHSSTEFLDKFMHAPVRPHDSSVHKQAVVEQPSAVVKKKTNSEVTRKNENVVEETKGNQNRRPRSRTI